MSDKIENIQGVIDYWMSSSDQNNQTMMNLFKSKDYDWCLFIGHLVLEKLLKAHFVKSNKKHPIFIHDLLRLAMKTKLQASEEQKDWLDEITTFNLNVRYDSYKQDFHQLCTKEFAEIWIERIEKLRKWLISEL
ncbi:HEPN domain-containing protein [uncultured Algoriphagus sp.]|uniref:HEPN domain-containing protein n=1 Tax=uncultured Algoriphagus sp. TaxID=417365 RepID=UPI0030EDF43D|tara:strand:- start:5963 stop:6364 length:402 start_codon:yes stop_codon:yes gene_type:complete